MNISFSCKEELFDNVTFAWVIESAINTYNLSIEFCEGINEDGEQDLSSSCYADIELTEIDHHDHDLMLKVFDLLKDDVDIELEQNYLQFGDDNETIFTRNESSYDDTMSELEQFMVAITEVLSKMEVRECIS